MGGISRYLATCTCLNDTMRRTTTLGNSAGRQTGDQSGVINCVCATNFTTASMLELYEQAFARQIGGDDGLQQRWFFLCLFGDSSSCWATRNGLYRHGMLNPGRRRR